MIRPGTMSIVGGAEQFGLDCHIITCNIECDDDVAWFVVGDTLEARFRVSEGEPTPPASFEVELVTFGGEFMTVRYRVMRETMVSGDLFYPSRAQEAFNEYRQSLIDFITYRQRLLARDSADGISR